MAMISPTHRLSPNFILADFLGNTTIYSKGLANGLDEDDRDLRKKLSNGVALCQHVLEPLLEDHGPMSISYGLIAPAVSRQIVTYQDQDKPSHHRWDLGAAADVCVHDWVEGLDGIDTTANSPAALAAVLVNKSLRAEGYPLSRLLSYSESPYLCLAASAEEIRRFAPRMAIYENRYNGRAKVKPEFRSYSNATSQRRWIEEMNTDVLAKHGWRGAGYPTHHGGGTQQFHHRRVSRYTMVSDWLFDLQTISNGRRNLPRLKSEAVLDAFGAAGAVYDALLTIGGIRRLSIVQGYRDTATSTGRGAPGDWSQETISFDAILPHGLNYDTFELAVRSELPFEVHCEHHGVDEDAGTPYVTFSFGVDNVLCNAAT